MLRASAPLFQLPYWAEPLRRIHFRPRYLAWQDGGTAGAFACILTMGFGSFRIGLVQRGPVSLDPVVGLTEDCLKGLCQWAKRRGYVFLRFGHSDPGVQEKIASLWPSERRNPFPFYPDLAEELIVTLRKNREDLLASFDREARRKIRKASAVPYQIEVTDSPDRLSQVWHLYQELSARKGFFFRPLASYSDLMTRARRFNAVRLYVVLLDQKPVNSLFQVNDSTTAFYMSGALNVEALEGKPTPVPMLVSRAMEDAANDGLQFFHFGSRSGVVYRFKSQFCPEERLLPAPVTVVLNRPLYRCWVSGLLPLAPKLKAWLKPLLADKREHPTE